MVGKRGGVGDYVCACGAQIKASITQTWKRHLDMGERQTKAGALPATCLDATGTATIVPLQQPRGFREDGGRGRVCGIELLWRCQL